MSIKSAKCFLLKARSSYELLKVPEAVLQIKTCEVMDMLANTPAKIREMIVSWNEIGPVWHQALYKCREQVISVLWPEQKETLEVIELLNVEHSDTQPYSLHFNNLSDHEYFNEIEIYESSDLLILFRSKREGKNFGCKNREYLPFSNVRPIDNAALQLSERQRWLLYKYKWRAMKSNSSLGNKFDHKMAFKRAVELHYSIASSFIPFFQNMADDVPADISSDMRSAAELGPMLKMVLIDAHVFANQIYYESHIRSCCDEINAALNKSSTKAKELLIHLYAERICLPVEYYIAGYLEVMKREVISSGQSWGDPNVLEEMAVKTSEISLRNILRARDGCINLDEWMDEMFVHSPQIRIAGELFKYAASLFKLMGNEKRENVCIHEFRVMEEIWTDCQTAIYCYGHYHPLALSSIVWPPRKNKTQILKDIEATYIKVPLLPKFIFEAWNDFILKSSAEYSSLLFLNDNLVPLMSSMNEASQRLYYSSLEEEMSDSLYTEKDNCVSSIVRPDIGIIKNVIIHEYGHSKFSDLSIESWTDLFEKTRGFPQLRGDEQDVILAALLTISMGIRQSLQCPMCEIQLNCREVKRYDINRNPIEGTLVCKQCGQLYPIKAGMVEIREDFPFILTFNEISISDLNQKR